MWRRRRALARVFRGAALALRVCSVYWEPCGLVFALPALALVAKAYFCVSMHAVTLPAA